MAECEVKDLPSFEDALKSELLRGFAKPPLYLTDALVVETLSDQSLLVGVPVGGTRILLHLSTGQAFELMNLLRDSLDLPQFPEEV